MKVYIAGAITNNPDFKEQFKVAEEMLKTQGHDVFNPAKNQGYTYRQYINMGLFELMHCDAIYMLSGWQQSTGAKLEYEYAKAAGIVIMYQESKLVTGMVKIEKVLSPKALKEWKKTLKETAETLDWQAAVKHVLELKELTHSLLENMYLSDLLIRYAVGERTKELYELMIKAH